MKLLTSYIESPSQRSAVRFVVVGTVGTALQYALYYGLLELLAWLFPTFQLVTCVFTVAYVIEVFVNYLLTAYYTFSTRPNTSNAGGFVIGRVFNYLIQIGLLHLTLFISNDEKFSGIVAILLSGIINFFVMHSFFRKS